MGLHVDGRVAKSIRDLAVAAPLKPAGLWRPPSVLNCYPRPRGRGPIEARYEPTHSAVSPAYPRPRGRGPIEAGTGGHLAGILACYPRPRGRGPIEVTTWRSCSTCYPRRGPLAQRGRQRGHDVRAYPRPRGRGPIEAHEGMAYRIEQSADSRQLSATSRSRPH